MSGFEIELPSSPDPLGDESSIVAPPASAAPPSTVKNRRVLQSAVSSRFSAIPGTSPRKRMFALDVGDEITHQTIYVTVEAGPDGLPITTRTSAGGSNVQRRLFGSPTPQPTPRRGAKTTTTTRKNKKGTPTPKATSQARATSVASSDALQSEAPAVLDKPTPKKRGRPPKRKADNALSEQEGPDASQPVPRKRGRIRRQSLNPDEVDQLVAASNDDVEPPNNGSPTSRGPDAPQDALSDPAVGHRAVPDLHEDEAEGDPFLAIASDPPAAYERPRQKGRSVEFSDPVAVQRYEEDPQVLENQPSPPRETDDYAPMMDYDDRSDEGSQQSEPLPSPPRIRLEEYGLDDQGLLPGESDYAPMLDHDKRSDEGFRSTEHATSSAQGQHENLELEDQGPLPGEPEGYAPPPDYDDRKDTKSHHSQDTPRAARQLEHQSSESQDQGPLPGESDVYAPMMDHDGRSDAKFNRDGHTAQSGDRSDNTIDPETFTMIGIETMPSFHRNRAVPTSDLPEIGETTSLFINRTLDSLRQEMVANEEGEGEVELLGSREPTPVEAETKRPDATTSSPQHQGLPPKLPVESLAVSRSSRSISRSSKRGEPEAPSAATSSPWNRAEPSQSPLFQMSQNSLRSTMRSKLSLAQATSKRSQRSIESSVRAVRNQQAEASRPNSDQLDDIEDDFSDIPDDVLAAAEPSEGFQPFSGPAEEAVDRAVDVVKDTSAENSLSQRFNSSGRQSTHRHVATKATPHHPDPQDRAVAQHSASHSAQSTRRSSQATQQGSPPPFIRSPSDPNRLLTPPDESTSSNNHGTPANDFTRNTERASMTPDEIGSSPPDIIAFQQEDERQVSSSRRNSDTPANPPPVQSQTVHERFTHAASLTAQSLGPRPVLSPIVRAGSRLQNILSDPPSPSGRSSVLGSPFKGSARNSSPLDAPQGEEAVQNAVSPTATSQNHLTQSAPQAAQPVAESPSKSWAKSFSSISRIKSMVSQLTSPKVNAPQTSEDPFGPSSPIEEQTGSTFMDRIRQASREEETYSRRRITIMRSTVGDDDERRWAGEAASIATEINTRFEDTQKPGLFGSGFFRGRSRHAEPSKSYDGAVDEEESDETHADKRSEQPQTDETEEAPAENEQHSTERRIGAAELLPGDTQWQPEEEEQWSEEDAMQVDDAAADDEHSEEEDSLQVVGAPADEEQSEEEDIWAIEADRTASSPRAQARANESSFSLSKKGELDIDWGTRSTMSQQPGRVPPFKHHGRSAPKDQLEDLDTYSLVGLGSGDSNQPSAKKPTSEPQQEPKKADLSDFFSSSPNFIERERRAREAFLAQSAAQSSAADQVAHIASPEMTGETQDSTSSSHEQLPSSSRSSLEWPSPGSRTQQRPEQVAPSHASPSVTPEQPRRPQHRPSPGRDQDDAALFETWSVSSPKAPSERPHITDSFSDVRPSSPDAIERPSTPVERAGPTLKAPLLKPLPGREASPSKSCLRSPLKPKTPGRVVGFTSSTLSPHAEAQARAALQNQASAPPASTTPLLNGHTFFPEERDKSASPDAEADTRPPSRHDDSFERFQDELRGAAESPLSQTQWSRRHWLALDELLQAHRRSPRGFLSRYGPVIGTASPGQRRSASLLGKAVASQGEEMVLEQWHLDVVDAFREEVGGWPEAELAKRLFALIVGEERRSLGLVPRRR
ncbi:hypothetical protein VPNG_04696 [Cytospora leucostoma]|uniref:Uncharacterized protein n=1 Tax=Cytospora leucostoma TaxID=1230097 RepID=A0A423XAJ5_9PEZI|nr:hypothetical protein VPNG_04696 [Cytospora leucostoma]